VILVDTNAWIAFLRSGDAKLAALLVQTRVRTCSVVLGELLLGTGLPRGFRADLAQLPAIPSPSAAETFQFIERYPKAFAGAGVGWADVQIILAAHKAGARIYTSDRAVRRVAKAVGAALA